MKKYLNKGLLYQWFNSAKAIIFLGLIVWGYLSYTMIGSQIDQMSWKIAENFDNNFSTFSLNNYLELGIIFIIIHLAGQGLSKRNNLMFLNSSPYTKKQIKYNEIISLMITEVSFIAVFLYMAVIRYFNYKNLLSIVDGYPQIIGIEVLKMILFGIAGILFVMIIDSMFSNSIIGMIAMVSAIPASIFFICVKIMMTIEYISVKDGKNIYALMPASSNNDDEFRRYVNPLIEKAGFNEISLTNICLDIIIIVVIIAVVFAIYCKMQKLNSLEYSTKIFSSRINEKVIRILCSIGAGCFASLMIVSNYIDKLQMGNYRIMYGALSGVNLIKGLSADVLCVVIIAFICNVVLKKILKIIE